MITRSDHAPTREDRLLAYQERLDWHGVNLLELRAKRRAGIAIQQSLYASEVRNERVQ